MDLLLLLSQKGRTDAGLLNVESSAHDMKTMTKPVRQLPSHSNGRLYYPRLNSNVCVASLLYRLITTHTKTTSTTNSRF